MRIISIGDLVTDFYYKNGKLIGVNGGMTSHNIIANIATALHTTTDDLLGQNNDEDVDFEQAYSQVQRLIARNAKHWSNAQKTGLVSAIFGEDE